MADLKTLKTMGRQYLSANRLKEALKLYLEILQDYPDDMEARLIIGDLYLASGDAKTAAKLYGTLLQSEPANVELKRRLDLAEAEGNKSPLSSGEPIPTHPEALGRLLQRLTGRTSPIPDEEVEKAAAMLQEIIHNDNPAQAVAEHLDEIDALIPALLELNIRQAQADGHPDIAEALESLLSNIQLQMGTFELETREKGEPVGEKLVEIPATRTKRVLLLTTTEKEIPQRVSLAAASLTACGYEPVIATESSSISHKPYDVVIAFNPHGDACLMESLAACTALKMPLIVDLDSDFEQMPVAHPDYASLGLGTPTRAKAYAASLLLADMITVPTSSLASSLTDAGYTARVLPDAWSRDNGLWEKPSQKRHTLNLGWVGVPGSVEEVLLIRRVIIRLLREYPELQLVISGDLQVFHLFETLPEPRRLYLPPVAAEDYPYLLGQVDILLVPARNIPFNRSLPDNRLLEAGIRSIPWVASPVPSFGEWHEGGFIVNTPDEWHSRLRQLIVDKELRSTLGKAGHQRAEGREVRNFGQHWVDAILQVLGMTPKLSMRPAQDKKAALEWQGLGSIGGM